MTAKPKDHGALRFVEPPKPQSRWIPKALRSIPVLEFNSGSIEDRERKYGRWKMKALKSCHAFGHMIQASETFSVPGNIGLELLNYGDAEFVDEQGLKAKEEAFDRTAKELAAPVDFQNEPAFQPKRPANSFRLPEFAPK